MSLICSTYCKIQKSLLKVFLYKWEAYKLDREESKLISLLLLLQLVHYLWQVTHGGQQNGSFHWSLCEFIVADSSHKRYLKDLYYTDHWVPNSSEGSALIHRYCLTNTTKWELTLLWDFYVRIVQPASIDILMLLLLGLVGTVLMSTKIQFAR